MRLRFNVLCFEDDKKYADEILEYLEGYLEDQGYSLNIIGIHKDGEPLGKYIEDINARKKDIDLILMDFQLAGGKNGDALIADIRTHSILTDIIIYSQDSDFLKKINSQLDGVYITHREGLRQKVVDVADHILKKELDLSNLRGLVMAETSELDGLMEDIILTFINGNFFKTPTKELGTIKKKLIEDSRANLEKLEKIDESKAAKVRDLISESLPSFHKARAITRLTNNFKKEIEAGKTIDARLKDIAQKLSGDDFDAKHYKEEILSLRNMLAHVKECKNEKGEKVLCSTPPRKDFVFTESQSLEARKNLKRYSEILKGIYETISGEKWDSPS